jgi:hypothetical protein
MEINDKQIQAIDRDLQRRGIADPSLREDMVDHICILIEGEPKGAFNPAYRRALKKFDSLKHLQEITRKEIESVSLSFRFFKAADYIITLFYVLLGLFSLILPIAVIFYHPIEIFFLLSPLLIFGYIICFTRINYKKFELIQF